jgi:nucleotide-binding universal stress UspA family protein
MEKRILVPLDGSQAAEIVIPYVEEIAAKINAEIILASVHEPDKQDMGKVYRAYLERIRDEVSSGLMQYGIREFPIRVVVLPGKPANEIIHLSEESNVGLIVLASRGASGQGPWLLGSIAGKVLRATKKPVLLIRVPASEVALEQKALLRKILVPLDGSKRGEGAIPLVQELGIALDAEVILFQTVQVPTVWPEEPSAIVTMVIEEGMAVSEAYLNSTALVFQKAGMKVSIVVMVGVPADRIIDYATENDVDLIAMSTHGRSGVGRWVFGSVTEKVLHAGDTPVLAVRPEEIGRP